MNKIMAIKEKYNLILLEDCSHSHGAKYKGKLTGSFGDASAWSLQGQKIITGGEGGIMLTNNSDIYYRANLLGHYNKRCKDEIPKENDLYRFAVTGFGLKLRAHPVAIALANQQFQNLDNWINQKNIFAEKIKKELSEISFLSFLNTENSYPSFYGLIMKFDNFNKYNVVREDFVYALQLEGLIEVDIPNSTAPLDKYEIFSNPKDSSIRQSIISKQSKIFDQFKNAYNFFNSVIKIPIWVNSIDENIIDLYISGFKKVVNEIEKNALDFKLNVNLFREKENLEKDKIQKVVVVGVISFENKILCLKRDSGDFMGGLVELPSGGVDSGEELISSLKREVFEESGIIISKKDRITFIDTFDYVSGSGKAARQINFKIELNCGNKPEIKLSPAEHSGFYWLNRDELVKYNISDETKNTILKSANN